MTHNYSNSYRNVSIRPLSAKDIENIRVWRNDPANGKYLSQINTITPEMQQEWFDNYVKDPETIFWAIDESASLSRMVGSAALYEISENSALFGKILIGDNEAHGKHVGVNATIAILQIAFDIMRLNTVTLYVYSDNVPAVKVYTKAGFKIIDKHMTSENRTEYTMEIGIQDWSEKSAKLE